MVVSAHRKPGLSRSRTTRLINEPLVDYVQPFGGGYFYTLPGVRNVNDWYARGLLT